MIAIITLLLTACERQVTPNPGEPIIPESIATGGIQIADIPETVSDWNTPLPEYPIIDGSSSTMLMHSAIRAFLTDEHFVDDHSQTYTSLERLFPNSDNPADIVLAVKYYDETLESAKERGAELVITPIAKEGFVFIVNDDNPVESLTQQQLQDIYSGEITNWKEVGGKNKKIVPFTRNWDSGSQTAMEDFMDGEDIIGEEDLAIGSMKMMLTEVEGEKGGIGYNIYSWSMLQSFEHMNIKTVAIDDVSPSNDALSDSSYPLMVYTYSYYNKGNEFGKSLTDWLLSSQGQSVIASAGYVGIYGQLPPPPEKTPDFYKDEDASRYAVEKFYENQDMGMVYFPEDSDEPEAYFQYSNERIQNRELALEYADGKEKDVTAMYLVHLHDDDNRIQFVVLTREKGGEFKVINVGEAPNELIKMSIFGYQ